MSPRSDTIEPLNISLFAVAGAKVIRPLCVLISSLLPGGRGANVAFPISLRILVRRFRTRGRSLQGPPARACAPARGQRRVRVGRVPSGWALVAGQVRPHFELARHLFSVFQLILDVPEQLPRQNRRLGDELLEQFKRFIFGQNTVLRNLS